MSFDPTLNSNNVSFERCTIRTSKHSPTGLIREDAAPSRSSLIHYLGKVYRWLRRPCTHMGSVWGRMHSQGLDTIRRSNLTGAQKLEKLGHLKANLEKFEVQVIDKHNVRRWKLFTWMHLAGVRIAHKDSKYHEIYGAVSTVLRDWNAEHPRLVDTYQLRSAYTTTLFDRFRDLRLTRQYADEIYQNPPAGAMSRDYQDFRVFQDNLVCKLLRDCTHKVAILARGNALGVQNQEQNTDLNRWQQEAVGEITQLYGVDSADRLPAVISRGLGILGRVVQAHGFAVTMREHEEQKPLDDIDCEQFYESNPVDEVAIQRLIDDVNIPADVSACLREFIEQRHATCARAQRQREQQEVRALQQEARTMLGRLESLCYGEPSIYSNPVAAVAYFDGPGRVDENRLAVLANDLRLDYTYRAPLRANLVKREHARSLVPRPVAPPPRIRPAAGAVLFKLPDSSAADIQQVIAQGRTAAHARIAQLEANGELEALQEKLATVFEALKGGKAVDVKDLPPELKAPYFDFIQENDDEASDIEKYVKSQKHPLALPKTQHLKGAQLADAQEKIAKIRRDGQQAKVSYLAILPDMCFIEALAEKCQDDVRIGLDLIVRAHILGVSPARSQCQINYNIPEKDFERLTSLETYQYFSKEYGTDYAVQYYNTEKGRQTSNNIPITTVGSPDRGNFRVVELEPVPEEIMDFLAHWKEFMGIEE